MKKGSRRMRCRGFYKGKEERTDHFLGRETKVALTAREARDQDAGSKASNCVVSGVDSVG